MMKAAAVLLPLLAALALATATPIGHVVIVVEENRAFDNLFGIYPFGCSPIVNNVTLSVMWPYGLYDNYSQLERSCAEIPWISVPNVPWAPWLGSSHPYYVGSAVEENPSEGWTQYHGDYWFGKPVGFAFYSGRQSLAYLSYQQAWPLWDLAEEYVLADDFFAPVLGLTEPNRVADLMGRPPGFYTDSAVAAVPFNESVMYQLEEAGVSWGYYVYGYGGGVPYPLTAFSSAEKYESHYGDYRDFIAKLGNCSIPAVSWVMFFGGSDDSYDMHPPHNATAGALAVLKLVEAVERSPCWNSTAVFITFDEGGGFYDQVAPPAVDVFGLGQRVPLIVVSPYAKEGYVDNDTISDYTILAFVDYNWGLPYLTQEVANSDLPGLLAAFNFSAPPRPPLDVDNWTYPLPLQYPVHYGYMATVPRYASYADVYRAPGLDVLPWLAALSIAALAVAAALRRKAALYASAGISAASTALSAYVHYAWPMYQFVTQYYLAASALALGAAALWIATARRRRPATFKHKP